MSFWTIDWKDRDRFDKFLVGVTVFNWIGLGYFLPMYFEELV